MEIREEFVSLTKVREIVAEAINPIISELLFCKKNFASTQAEIRRFLEVQDTQEREIYSMNQRINE